MIDYSCYVKNNLWAAEVQGEKESMYKWNKKFIQITIQ